MTANPYQSPVDGSKPVRTRSTRWLVWSGAFNILLSFILVVVAFDRMATQFGDIAQSKVTPKPTQVAVGIGNAMRPLYFAGPLGIIGIGLLIAGFVVRQPVE